MRRAGCIAQDEKQPIGAAAAQAHPQQFLALRQYRHDDRGSGARAASTMKACWSSPTISMSPPSSIPSAHRCDRRRRPGAPHRWRHRRQAAVDFIRQFKVDYAVIGVSAIDDDGALLDFDYREVRVSQAIIANARQVILVSDRMKFTRSAPVRIGHISQIDVFVTDQIVRSRSSISAARMAWRRRGAPGRASAARLMPSFTECQHLPICGYVCDFIDAYFAAMSFSYRLSYLRNCAHLIFALRQNEIKRNQIRKYARHSLGREAAGARLRSGHHRRRHQWLRHRARRRRARPHGRAREQGDLAGATSSASTKLIHGGLRYLEHSTNSGWCARR